MKALSWKPVKRGTKYCAPACGRGCTVAQHDYAVRQGKAMAKRLGRGWRARVWENLGWHYSAKQKDIEVHDFGAYFWASLSGDGIPQFIGEGKTPELAARRAANKAAAAVTRLAAVVRRVNRAASG